jgi:hypothetical protein
MWWFRPVIPAFGRQRQENHEFKAGLGYIARPCIKKNQQENISNKANIKRLYLKNSKKNAIFLPVCIDVGHHCLESWS